MPPESTARSVTERRQWVVRSDLVNGLPRPQNPILDFIVSLCRERPASDQEQIIQCANQFGLITEGETFVLKGLHTLTTNDAQEF